MLALKPSPFQLQHYWPKARQSLLVILGIVVAIFAIAIYLVNLWLNRYVVRPINRMAAVAEAVSLGDTEASFTKRSDDEVGKLAEAFNRMRLSLDPGDAAAATLSQQPTESIQSRLLRLTSAAAFVFAFLSQTF